MKKKKKKKKKEYLLIKLITLMLGRIGPNGFIHSTPYPTKNRDSASTGMKPSAPEEVLFRRVNAPTRYEENDLYFAHESLPANSLPSSEILEAIHSYAADFYDQTIDDRGLFDYQTMDETALIAMGILLEEMAGESLGETGDLVLVEGERIVDEGEDNHQLLSVQAQPSRGGRKRVASAGSGILASSGDDVNDFIRTEPVRKGRKRSRRNAMNT